MCTKSHLFLYQLFLARCSLQMQHTLCKRRLNGFKRVYLYFQRSNNVVRQKRWAHHHHTHGKRSDFRLHVLSACTFVCFCLLISFFFLFIPLQLRFLRISHIIQMQRKIQSVFLSLFLFLFKWNAAVQAANTTHHLAHFTVTHATSKTE